MPAFWRDGDESHLVSSVSPSPAVVLPSHLGRLICDRCFPSCLLRLDRLTLPLPCSANVLFLASTVMVPIGNVAFSLKFVPHHQDLHLSDTLGLLFILTGGDTTLAMKIRRWLASNVFQLNRFRRVLAGTIYVVPSSCSGTVDFWCGIVAVVVVVVVCS